MDHPALTESTYYILLSLYHPRHGYGIMQETSSSPAEGYGWLPEPCTVP